MSTQLIVDPSKIEPELLKLWEGVSKEKNRACLFNLIVFNTLSIRTDYIRDIIRKVSEKYPCRVLFISSDPTSATPYLKTAVSVVGSGTSACDYIDIGVSGSAIEKVPFLLFPHIIPDLPVSLLWTEDPNLPHPLFTPLAKLANRLIFDSESADSLLLFSEKVLQMRKESPFDTADLNWARTEGWRDLIGSLFRSGDQLHKIKQIQITYNSQKTESFCHLKVQSMYLLAWLASRLKWNFKSASPDLNFIFEKQKGEIRPAKWEKLGPGTIISVEITTSDGYHYQCSRNPKQYNQVSIQISSPDRCELPYQFILGRTGIVGPSLIKEIITKGTSGHYLDMLKTLSQMDRDQLC